MGNKSKRSLADLSHDLDLQVMQKDDMNKIFGGTDRGGKNTWNSCGGITPQ